MCSTHMKRTVQIVRCISMSEPHELSLTVFVTDNQIFLGEVKVDFDMLLKLLLKVIQK